MLRLEGEAVYAYRMFGLFNLSIIMMLRFAGLRYRYY